MSGQRETRSQRKDPTEVSARSDTSEITASRRSNESHASKTRRGEEQQSPNITPRNRLESDPSEVSSNGSSTRSSPSNRRHHEHRPRFDSRASWADSTRFDMGVRASDVSVKDLRLSTLSQRSRADSRTSSRLSGRSRNGPRHRKDSNSALSTITENWNLLDDQFNSPFASFNAQDQPIQEQLERGLEIVNEHSSKLKEIEDAITGSMSEVWGYWVSFVCLMAVLLKTYEPDASKDHMLHQKVYVFVI